MNCLCFWMHGMRKGRGPAGLGGRAFPEPVGVNTDGYHSGILCWDTMVGYSGIQREYDGILWCDTGPCVRGWSGGHLYYTPSPLSPPCTLQCGVWMDHIGRLHRGLRPVTRPTVMGRRLNRELARCGSLCHTAAGVWRRCHTSTLPRCGTSCATLTKVPSFYTAHMCGVCVVPTSHFHTFGKHGRVKLPVPELNTTQIVNSWCFCQEYIHFSKSSCTRATPMPWCRCGWCDANKPQLLALA